MLSRKKLMLAGMTLMAATSFAQAKYVFYFIGDGMGAGQRQITEEFKKGARWLKRQFIHRFVRYSILWVDHIAYFCTTLF